MAAVEDSDGDNTSGGYIFAGVTAQFATTTPPALRIGQLLVDVPAHAPLAPPPSS
jgi:hypothetical protein